jgi:hypothetical protein
MSQWYYAHDGKQSGPVPISELERLAGDGKFDPEKDLVWREGQPDWKPAATVPELEALFKKKSSMESAPVVDSAPAASPYQAPSSQPAPSYQATPAQVVGPTSNGLAVASLVCGLVGLLTCFIWCLSIPLAIAAIVTGHLASSKIKGDPARYSGKGLARTGLITGYLGLVLCIVFIALATWLSTLSPEKLQEMGVPPEIIEQLETQRKLQERMQEQSAE